MIKTIPPSQFKQIPWKNGKGVTTELAISEGGSISQFDWRLSIASVTEDGAFSDFSGYERNLILIEGNGINLKHTQDDAPVKVDRLASILDFANFDGGWRTEGQLHDGSIKDLNLMTSKEKYHCQIETWVEQQSKGFKLGKLNFLFSLSESIQLLTSDKSNDMELPPQHLAIIDSEEIGDLVVTGSEVVFITLNEKRL